MISNPRSDNGLINLLVLMAVSLVGNSIIAPLNPMKTKTEALELLQAYRDAAIRTYCAHNERTRYSPEAAIKTELKIARKLFSALSAEPLPTDDELMA